MKDNLFNKTYALHFFFFCCFMIHSSSILEQYLNPTTTSTAFHTEDLTVQGFPTYMKLCVTMPFNETLLKEYGYINAMHYFLGRSQYNKSIYGWSGHFNESGKVKVRRGDLLRLAMRYHKVSDVLEQMYIRDTNDNKIRIDIYQFLFR